MAKFFRLIQHTADLQIVVYGKTLSDLFAHSVIAMFQSITPEVHGCQYDDDGLLVCLSLPEQHDVIIEAKTRQELLVNFLSEALYLSDVHNEAYLAVDIHQLTPKIIKATLRGVVVEGFEEEIKAVTYHNLSVEQKDGMWQATIVFDI